MGMSDTYETNHRGRVHRQVFLKAHPAGPWTCHSCTGQIIKMGQDADSLDVHHLDEDKRNNTLKNLASAHHGCHVSFHQTGRTKTFTDAHRAAISHAKQGRKTGPASEERKHKISAALKGQPKSEVTKQKLREAALRRHGKEVS